MGATIKAAVLISAAAAIVTQAWLGATEWPALLPLTLAATAGTGVLMRVRPSVGWAPLLLTAYLFPVVVFAARGVFLPAYHAIWLGGLFGAIVGQGGLTRWHLPPAWRLPLAFSALVVALSWPVVALRETNFRLAALNEYSLANSGLGGPPPVVIVGMMTAVATIMLGVLFFDALFARFRDQPIDALRRQVLLPAVVSVAAGSVLAIYQWTVDIGFLSAHQWPYYGRAAGGLLNGNAFGAIEGLWSAPVLTFALAGGGAAPFAGGLVVTFLLWFGLWATGSRMALLAALVGLWFVGFATLRGRKAPLPRKRIVTMALGLVAVAAVLGALGQFGAHTRFGMDPITRTLASLPKPNRASIERFVEFELWNRFGPFGSASVRMIRDSPLVGTGAGTFEILYPDYAHRVTGGRTRSHFDNAQSWYRHRLAELGLVGTLGWAAWLVSFGMFVRRAAPARDGLTEATGVKAALVATAIISIVSMPTRNAFVALSFWLFAFWLVKATGEPADTGRLARLASRRAAWVAVWLVAIAFTVGTAWVAHAALRPPYRALMADWNYVNGISRPVTTGSGRRLYADQEGVAVFAARPGYLRLAFQLPHGDAASDPVAVRIYRRDELVASLRIADRDEHTIYVPVPDGQDRMMIRTWVSREAAGDAPARGLILRPWSFTRTLPPGAMIAGAPIGAR